MKLLDRDLEISSSEAVATHRTDKPSAPFLKLLKDNLLDLSSDAVFICDDTFRFCYINSAATSLTGFSSSELLGQPVDLLLPKTLRSSHREQMVSFAAVEGISRSMNRQRQISCQTKDGAVVKTSGALTTMTQDGKRFFGVVLRDQTERDELLAKLERKERALSLALQKAQLAISARSHFLSKASHELRTPLNAILGFSQLLANWQGPPSEEMARDYGQYILGSGEALLHVVNQILEFSELNSDYADPNLQPFALEDLLESVATAFGPKAEEAKINLRLEVIDGADSFIDYPRMWRALSNVIDNAIRYTAAGGNVTLRLEKTAKGIPVINIEDTGQGIARDRLVAITKPFELSADSPHGVSNGIGLGLATAKTIVAMHGGRLRIRSKPARGTTVSISLPDIDPLTRQKTEHDSNPADKKSRTIFYI